MTVGTIAIQIVIIIVHRSQINVHPKCSADWQSGIQCIIIRTVIDTIMCTVIDNKSYSASDRARDIARDSASDRSTDSASDSDSVSATDSVYSTHFFFLKYNKPKKIRNFI